MIWTLDDLASCRLKHALLELQARNGPTHSPAAVDVLPKIACPTASQVFPHKYLVKLGGLWRYEWRRGSCGREPERLCRMHWMRKVIIFSHNLSIKLIFEVR
jgi:hypothetical protein